jgi:hypothetical protein
MFQLSQDHVSAQILAVPRYRGMGRAVEIDPVMYVRTGVGVKIAVDLSIVVCLGMAASRIQGLDSSRAGEGSDDHVQLNTVVGAGTAGDKGVDRVAVSAPFWLGTIAPSQEPLTTMLMFQSLR